LPANLDPGFLESLSAAAEVLLRATVGLLLIPHGLRAFYGFFPNSGSRLLNKAALAASLAKSGYRPGMFWATVVWIVEFVAGPMLALGLCTRLAAFLVFAFMLGSTVDHARADGYFWNKLGLEYPLLWSIAALYFVFQGGGGYSIDFLIGW